MQKINNNIFVETGFQGCNCGFVTTADGIVMIDTPMVPAEAVRWREEISRHGTVRYLINTEPHGDHFSGNYFYSGEIIAHEGTRETILGSSLERFKGMIPPGSAPLDEHFYFRPPTITLSQRLTLYLGKHTFHLINMPGHTPYQLAVYIPEERTVFTSDNVVGNMPFMHQAVPSAWFESLKQLEQMDMDILVPGHGEVGNKSYIPQMKQTLQQWTDVVRDAIAEGLSLKNAQEKILKKEAFKPGPGEERLQEVKRNNIARLYDIYTK